MVKDAGVNSSYFVLGFRGEALGSGGVVSGEPVIFAFL